MAKTDDAPGLRTEGLKATIGVDSIHIRIKINSSDLKRFCVDAGCKYAERRLSLYQRKWLLFLEDGEPITARYHFRSKTMKFEIGNLMHYSKIQHRHHFIQALVAFFSDREQRISRIDISADVNKRWDELIVDNDAKIRSLNFVNSTLYYNSTGSTFTVYDKSGQMQIYSSDVTRLELRLKSQLSSWKVTDFTENLESMEKLSKKVEEYFSQKIQVYSVDGSTLYSLKMAKIDTVLKNFIAFMHGDSIPEYKDHFSFRIRQAVEKRDRFFKWMKENRLSSAKVNRFIKGRRSAVCKELNLDPKTLKKAIKFYTKAIPNFKFS